MRLRRPRDRRAGATDHRAYTGEAPHKRAVLHVGAPKTGTTYLQQVLWKNRDVLGAKGIGYPLEDPREHFAATMDLREMTWGDRRDPEWDGAWDRIAERARQWPGPCVVISNELLGAANAEQIQRAVSSLHPVEVRIVFTARDLARQLPSDWQEQVKHTHAITFDEFVDDLVAHGIAAREPFGPMFWGLHDPVRVLRPWADVVGADHVHVVTVPPHGAPRDALWRRFAGVLGLDPDTCDLEVEDINPSLGAVEAELLRRTNERADRKQPRSYREHLRGQLIDEVLSRRPGRPIALPDRHLDWVRKRSQELIDGVRDAGYDVVGDLTDLQPATPTTDAIDPARITETAILDAALDALAGLVTEPAEPHG